MGYEYAEYGMAGMGSTAGIMLVLMSIYYLLTFGLAIASYVLQSLGMYTIAQRREIKHPWLAWVPYGNLWILGSISDQYQYVAQGKVRSRRKLLIGLQIGLSVLVLAFFIMYVWLIVQAFSGFANVSDAAGITFVLVLVVICLIMLVLSVLLSVFQYICYYNLYASCDPQNKVLFLVLSILIGVTLPFFVFACRKKDLGMPPKKTDAVTPAMIDPPAFEE